MSETEWMIMIVFRFFYSCIWLLLLRTADFGSSAYLDELNMITHQQWITIAIWHSIYYLWRVIRRSANGANRWNAVWCFYPNEKPDLNTNMLYIQNANRCVERTRPEEMLLDFPTNLSTKLLYEYNQIYGLNKASSWRTVWSLLYWQRCDLLLPTIRYIIQRTYTNNHIQYHRRRAYI